MPTNRGLHTRTTTASSGAMTKQFTTIVHLFEFASAPVKHWGDGVQIRNHRPMRTQVAIFSPCLIGLLPAKILHHFKLKVLNGSVRRTDEVNAA
jgi:hypothetical protein